MKLRNILTVLLMLTTMSLFGGETINHQVNYTVQPTINNSGMMTTNGNAAGLTNVTASAVTNAISINFVSNNTTMTAGTYNGTNGVFFNVVGNITNFWLLF